MRIFSLLCLVAILTGCGEVDFEPQTIDGELAVEVENATFVTSEIDSAVVVLADGEGASSVRLRIEAEGYDLDDRLHAAVSIIETTAIDEAPSDPLLVPLDLSPSGDRVGSLTLRGDSTGAIRIRTTVLDESVETVVEVQPLSQHLELTWDRRDTWGCYELGASQAQELTPELELEAPRGALPDAVTWKVTGPAVLERPMTLVEQRDGSNPSVGESSARIVLPPNLQADAASSLTISATAGGVTLNAVVAASADCAAN